MVYGRGPDFDSKSSLSRLKIQNYFICICSVASRLGVKMTFQLKSGKKACVGKYFLVQHSELPDLELILVRKQQCNDDERPDTSSGGG